VARVSEVYASFQGEGPRTGIPTTFLRFAGCNLRCAGWPCDTPHAIFPKLIKADATLMSPEQIVAAVCENYPRNVCFTGGEPFLQPKKEIHDIAWSLHLAGKDLEFFSNGTLPYPDWAVDNSHIMMDWKLTGSGEDPRHQMRYSNLQKLLKNGKHSVKFVVKDRNDFDEAVTIWADHLRAKPIQTWAGVVWGELDPAQLTHWMLEKNLSWRLNIQTHNYIWPPHERRR
jgi:7-carboxy-7-deazaguanine synthase